MGGIESQGTLVASYRYHVPIIDGGKRDLRWTFRLVSLICLTSFVK